MGDGISLSLKFFFFLVGSLGSLGYVSCVFFFFFEKIEIEDFLGGGGRGVILQLYT